MVVSHTAVFLKELSCNLMSTSNYIEAQGYKVRKVISEVYASFVLQCTVYGR